MLKLFTLTHNDFVYISIFFCVQLKKRKKRMGGVSDGPRRKQLEGEGF